MFNNKKQNKKIIHKEKIDVSPEKVKKTSSGSGFYYSFLTIILLLCLIQITISAVLNVSKIVSYKAKINQITKTRDEALALNDQLNDNIKHFSNLTGLEAIARNNLKMSGEDEVLVIINTQKEDEIEKPHKFDIFGFINKKD
jgi:cell division protein FtsB